MLFNSLIFVLFAALFFSFFWLVRKKNHQLTWGYIVVFSFFFYGWWDWRFLFLIIGSGLIDFIAGQAIYKYPRYKKPLLVLSIVANLGTLGAFKYSRFIFTQIELLLLHLGYTVNLSKGFPEFLFILPIGISFYTFQSMSYTIDVYKGNLKPTRHILKFFAYLSLFPQLVAGPIVRAKTLLPQLDRLNKPDELQRWHGMKLIAVGYFKKVLIADNLAPFVNTGFANVNQTESSFFWWMMILAFAFQIYCDFSGYTDIARGLAKWMGFHFKMNFNHPYRATSIRDFWQRWHISLSNWFRDYVYIPLGGSRKGKLRGHFNMWVTMVVSGFWHGASWNFIIWGAVHAFYMSLERITKWSSFFKRWRLSWLATIVVMFQVLLAWVFFRAQNLTDAFVILKNMLSFNTNMDFPITEDIRNGWHYLLLALSIEYIFIRMNLQRHIRNCKWRWFIEIVSLAVMISATIFFRGKGHEFIYFQF